MTKNTVEKLLTKYLSKNGSFNDVVEYRGYKLIGSSGTPGYAVLDVEHNGECVELGTIDMWTEWVTLTNAKYLETIEKTLDKLGCVAFEYVVNTQNKIKFPEWF